MISGRNDLAPLKGLVLAGGKSVRMGRDKGSLQWHGKEQRYYAADLLSFFCSEVYISCRSDQAEQMDKAYKVLPDIYTGLGPYGGILTALDKDQGAAWLVVACDLPLLNHDTLAFLVAHRDPNKIATSFRSPHDGLPEPLITIWEPQSRVTLLSFLEQGYRCPRKVLIKSEVPLLDAPHPEALANTNTPEDAEKVNAILTQQRSKKITE